MPGISDVVAAELSPSPPEVRERERVLWTMLLRARYVGIVSIALLALYPFGGESRYWLTAGLLAIVLPYNAVHDVVLRRQDRLLPTMAVGDQVLVVATLAIEPRLVAVAALLLLAVNATNAAAFGRTLAAVTAALGVIGSAAVLAIDPPPNALPILLMTAIGTVFLIAIVGGIAQMERDLRFRYGELMGGIDAIVWEQLTTSPSTLYVSGGVEAMLGYPASEWAEPGGWSRHVHPDDRIDTRRAYREAIRSGTDLDVTYRLIARDGRVVHVHDRMRVELDDIGRPTHVRGVMLDITAAKLAEQRANQFIDLAENIALALFVFELADDYRDDSLRILAVNPAAAEITALDPVRSVGQSLDKVMAFPDEHDDVLANLADVVRTGQPWSDDSFRLGGDANVNRTFNATAFPLPGRAVGLALQDVTDRVMAAEVLRRQALHDALTGLPNRVRIRERLALALAPPVQADARPGAATAPGHVALLMMDVDQFKDVNDALGHGHGDRLLIELSRRLQRTLRSADTIARLGGDEFAVLLRDVPDVETAVDAARSIRTALELPFQIGGITVQASAPIGIALSPDHGTDPDLLLQHADVAMYVAKRGGTGITVYSAELDSSSVKRLTLLAQLRRAIDAGELVLHYQPALDLRTGRVHGAEALVRWQHPEFGLMGPAEFIELAEVSGAIAPLTRWVISTVLTQLRDWSDDPPGGSAGTGSSNGTDGNGINGNGTSLLRLGCNLSVRNLHDRELVPWLRERLASTGVEPARLKLEITESELMDDPAQAMEVLGQLKALGAETSIDDFGTGYSSLAYLKSLPIDELKIDKSFIDNVATDAHDLAIVRSTIDLSHHLGLSVTAEGVEDERTLRTLAELGCDRAQGYFVSRPVPADQFRAWLDDDDRQSELRAILGA